MALYGGEAPEGIEELLREAMGSYADTNEAEAKLLQAKEKAPESLAVYFSLYKFYFYKNRLPDAERTAREALTKSASQGGFSPNWEELAHDSADWKDEAPHFYLFSLKALAFMRLRQGDRMECERILDKLGVLDCRDSVGSSVIREIAQGADRAENGKSAL